MHIALITPFSPEIGGGSVQLRSLLPEMRDLDITWYYLADSATAAERCHWLGKPLSRRQFVSDLFARTGFLPGSIAAVRELIQRIPADVYWVVAHNEGVSIAAELCAKGKRVHLTVHDDPVCLFQRSLRLRAFTPLISHHLPRLLRAVDSIDVISPSLQDAYKRRYNVNSFSVYRYLAELPRFDYLPAPGTLTIGHIGSLYHPKPFRHFIAACRQYAAEEKLGLKILRIGSSPEMDIVANEQPELFQAKGELDEHDALPILAACDFVYAMYPDGKRFRCFRQTSLPMKLSTYIQAQRPIFAHTPSDSSLASIVGKYKLGAVCTTIDELKLRDALLALLQTEIPRSRFEQVHAELMGPGPLLRLRAALTGEALRPAAQM